MRGIPLKDLQKHFVEAYNKGVSVKKLCAQYDICKSTAYNWIRKYSSIKRTQGKTITAEAYYKLERENRTLRTENEILKRCGCAFESPLADKLAAIDRLKSDYTVYMLCKTLGILSSTYYHHALRSPIKKWNELKDDELRPLIKEIFVNSQERFGAQKIKFILKQQGKNVSRAHISRLMQEMGLICKQLRLRYYSTTNRKYKVYRNRIQQNFMTETPNMVWVSDITHVHVKDKLHSIGVIIDLYARMVVAHKVSATADVAFIQGMFDAAFEMRGRPEGLIFHSDQGLQYTSFVFRRHLRELKVKQSFSNPGTPLDNAVAESFFAWMKREELSHNYYDTIEELQRDVDEYVEFFNNMRPHQRLGMQTPSEVERNFAVKK